MVLYRVFFAFLSNNYWQHPPPQDLTSWKPSHKPVWIFRTPSSVIATGTDVNFVHVFDENETLDLERFDPDSVSFLPYPTNPSPSEAYQNYATAWQAYLKHETSSSVSLRDAVRISRETSVLLPLTAYIVLENEAQEKMMKLKEQQKLSGQDALDFMDTPEPGTLALGLIAIALAWFHTRSRKPN